MRYRQTPLGEDEKQFIRDAHASGTYRVHIALELNRTRRTVAKFATSEGLELRTGRDPARSVRRVRVAAPPCNCGGPHCGANATAAGHRFRDDLLCDCGASQTGFQADPNECPEMMRGEKAPPL